MSHILTAFNPHSPVTQAMEGLFIVTLWVCAFLFVVVAGGTAYCIFKFRAKPGDDVPPKQIMGYEPIEIIWTVVPALIVVLLLVLTYRVMGVEYPPTNQQPDITITGHQWWWEAQYPSGIITAGEFHIPVGKRMLLRLKSADVLHAFWVPELARMMNTVPGEPKDIWLEADKPGVYQGYCGEFCGDQHAHMFFKIYADSPADFAKWQQQQLKPAPQPTTPEEIKGAQLFSDMTCITCHAIKGFPTAMALKAGFSDASAEVAPNLTHLASRHTLASGVLTNNRANLTRWLTDPQKIKPGCYMPDFKLKPEQVKELVDYFETLK